MQLVSLDVGGTVYTASRQTFAAVPESWFTRMLAGDVHLPRTSQDVRFVDRDAQVHALPHRSFRKAAAVSRPESTDIESLELHCTFKL